NTRVLTSNAFVSLQIRSRLGYPSGPKVLAERIRRLWYSVADGVYFWRAARLFADRRLHMEAGASPFVAWESFYVIIGSGSAALTGLQFVVIVLSAELNAPGSDSITRAFGTPTIVHFCAALFISAILSAPWPALASAGIALGAGGVAGFVYAV